VDVLKVQENGDVFRHFTPPGNKKPRQSRRTAWSND
jgi:hypothetical protein